MYSKRIKRDWLPNTLTWLSEEMGVGGGGEIGAGGYYKRSSYQHNDLIG